MRGSGGGAGTDRLLDGCGVVEAVALEDVDIVELQALETLLDGVEDVLYRARTRGECMLSIYRKRGWGRREGTHLAVKPLLVDDAVLDGSLRGDVRVEAGGDGEEDFGEDDELLARELERFDRFAEHDLGAPVGVHLWTSS